MAMSNEEKKITAATPPVTRHVDTPNLATYNIPNPSQYSVGIKPANGNTSQPDDRAKYTFTEDQLWDKNGKPKDTSDFYNYTPGPDQDPERPQDAGFQQPGDNRTFRQRFIDENKSPILTEEEERKQNRRRRLKTIIAAIGDGVGAIGSMVNGAKGMLPTQYTSKSLTEKLQERWKEIDREREAKIREWRAQLARAEQLDQNANYRDALAKARDEAARIKAEEAKNRNTNRDSRTQMQNNKDQAAIDLNEKRGNLVDAQTTTERGKPAVQQSQIERNRNTGKAALISANKKGTGKGGTSKNSKGEFEVYDKDGNLVGTYKTKAAADQKARQLGTYVEKTVEKEDDKTDRKHRTTTTRTTGGYAGKPAPKPAPKPTQQKSKPASGKKNRLGL